MIYHRSMGANYYGLFATSAFLNDANIWADTEPTNEHFYVSVHNSPAGYSNGPNGTFISYVWHDVPGLQKFGSYTGNGSADGPFVYTGFKVRWLMIKRSSSSGYSWQIHDTERLPYNVNTKALFANGPYSEYTFSVAVFDLLSNGFKPRGGDSYTNASGETYIYAAFAETPTFNLYGGQANAR